jgi:spore coat protein A
MRVQHLVVALAGLTVGATVAATAPAGAAAPGDVRPTALALVPASALRHFVSPLPVPPVVDARAGGVVHLDEVNGTNRFSSDLRPTPTFGCVLHGQAPPPGGTYLGPTIEVRRGTPLALTVTNRLSGHPLAAYVDTSLEGVSALDRTAPRTVTHLHGGHVPVFADGEPIATYRRAGVDTTDTAGGSGTVTSTYPNDQAATELWYHDHAMGITRLNVLAGLAGVYLVRDAFDTGRAGNRLRLPYGAYELPLVLQDRSFHRDGSFAYPIGPFAGDTRADYPDQWAPEFFGDALRPSTVGPGRCCPSTGRYTGCASSTAPTPGSTGSRCGGLRVVPRPSGCGRSAPRAACSTGRSRRRSC